MNTRTPTHTPITPKEKQLELELKGSPAKLKTSNIDRQLSRPYQRKHSYEIHSDRQLNIHYNTVGGVA